VQVQIMLCLRCSQPRLDVLTVCAAVHWVQLTLQQLILLLCGMLLQGRGLATQAYTHSLETSHHMFMKLDNGKVSAQLACRAC
jgi:hypothetical protein